MCVWQCWGVSGDRTNTAPFDDMFVVTMTLGTQDTCVLEAAGCVYCIGNGEYEPIDCTDSNVIAISSGGGRVGHHFAVMEDGSVLGWGSNLKGQLGVGDTASRDYGVPLLMDLPDGWLPAKSPTPLSARYIARLHNQK